MTIQAKDPNALAAFCTGLYEAAGSAYFCTKFSWKNNKVLSQPALTLQLIMPHLEHAKAFQEFANGGTIHGPIPVEGKDPVWSYYLSNSDKVINVMHNMDLAWLSQYKRAQFDFAHEQYIEAITHGN